VRVGGNGWSFFSFFLLFRARIPPSPSLGPVAQGKTEDSAIITKHFTGIDLVHGSGCIGKEEREKGNEWSTREREREKCAKDWITLKGREGSVENQGGKKRWRKKIRLLMQK
jgi:hypothetical protein